MSVASDNLAAEAPPSAGAGSPEEGRPAIAIAPAPDPAEGSPPEAPPTTAPEAGGPAGPAAAAPPAVASGDRQRASDVSRGSRRSRKRRRKGKGGNGAAGAQAPAAPEPTAPPPEAAVSPVSAPAAEVAAPPAEAVAARPEVAAPAAEPPAPQPEAPASQPEVAAPPAEVAAAPVEVASPPAEVVAPPAEVVAAPAEVVAAPAEVASPPPEVAAPLPAVAAPVVEVAPAPVDAPPIAMAATEEHQALWFALARSRPRSVALVAVESGVPVGRLAQALAEVGRRLGDDAVAALAANPCDYEFVGRAKEMIGSARRRPSASPGASDLSLIVAIPPVTREPLGLAVAQAVDAVVLCFDLGRTTIDAARETIDLVGRDRILGCVAIEGAEAPPPGPAAPSGAGG